VNQHKINDLIAGSAGPVPEAGQVAGQVVRPVLYRTVPTTVGGCPLASVIHSARIYALELKDAAGVSKEQVACHARLERVGAIFNVALVGPGHDLPTA
jgi:hypothetical protein